MEDLVRRHKKVLNGNDSSLFLDSWREISESERKAVGQLDDLRSRLLAKETELSLLQADINMLSIDRDNKIVEIEGLSNRVQRLYDENELSLTRIKEFESQLDTLKERNNELTQELSKKSEVNGYGENHGITGTLPNGKSFKTEIGELQLRVRECGEKIRELEKERDKLLEERDSWETEREEELRALQNALDDALEQKIKIQTKYEHEFEVLRTTYSSQEEQLMNDFEWKLRQIEQNCKKKVEDKEAQVQEKLKEAKGVFESEFAAEREKLVSEKAGVESQLKQLSYLKSYEAEVVQLRGLTQEQQKSIRAASRQIEHLKFNEKLLQEEIRVLKLELSKEKSTIQSMQSTNARLMETREETIASKVEKEKVELNSKWEERMKNEIKRVRQDLSQVHDEEKNLAIEATKQIKDKEITEVKINLQNKHSELEKEVSKLKEKLSDKDSYCQRELERVTVQADRDAWELRRNVEKLSINNMEIVEDLKSTHSTEIETLTEKHQQQVDELQERISELENQVRLAKTQNPVQVKVTNNNHVNTNHETDESESEEEESEEEESEEDDEEEVDEESEGHEVTKVNGVTNGVCGDEVTTHPEKLQNGQKDAPKNSISANSIQSKSSDSISADESSVSASPSTSSVSESDEEDDDDK